MLIRFLIFVFLFLPSSSFAARNHLGQLPAIVYANEGYESDTSLHILTKKQEKKKARLERLKEKRRKLKEKKKSNGVTGILIGCGAAVVVIILIVITANLP